MNECVAVLAVCEAPQGHSHLVLSINPVFILDFSLFSCSLVRLSAVPSDQIASAVGTCVRRMHQLVAVSTFAINPLPVFLALGDRECPLDHFQVDTPLWVCTILVGCTGLIMQCFSVRSCEGVPPIAIHVPLLPKASFARGS